ncbi:transposase [Pseudomonas bharatica]|jgi:hypothetical protein|uniref:transposase n=1 Tax=Pseudomonas bharatica TaxID=2692112 RepID=UPI003B28AC6B
MTGLDARLIKRYDELVMGHTNALAGLAAGMKALPRSDRAFAQTQAMWRFLGNDRVKPSDLVKPLLALAHEGCSEDCDEYALVMHDWSRINFMHHHSKTDRLQMTHKGDVGYELQSSLLVSDRDGSPICTPAQNLSVKDGILSTRTDELIAHGKHMDELVDRAAWLEQQGFTKPLVHIVDREADSAGHLRQLQAGNHLWLVRARMNSTAQYQNRSLSLKLIAEDLPFRAARGVVFKGKPAIQWVAETDVVLTRKAQPAAKSRAERFKLRQPGTPLPARLVVSRVMSEAGELLATWYLLSNVGEDANAEQIALWYYWRWRIESYFKLLKEGGQQLESWQQESGEAVFKRLLIASQACAVAWRLMRAEGQFAEQTRTFLVRLSGRQMKRSQPVTASALLAGLYMLLAMTETLEQYSPQELAAFANEAVGWLPRQRR